MTPDTQPHAEMICDVIVFTFIIIIIIIASAFTDPPTESQTRLTRAVAENSLEMADC